MQRAIFIPGCTIPDIKYKDADEIYVEKGRYPRGGYRYGGQYQHLAGLHKSWDVAARTAVDIDAEYSAGVTSGMIGAAKVNSSWYSLFLMASTPIVLVLPYLRVDTIGYTSDTKITPAAHSDGTTAENGFIVANDAWNGYRLVKHDIEDASYDGAIYTIADTVNTTPDEIHITGDITGQVAAADWLQLIPPVNVDCCYLGEILINSSGNITAFKKAGWQTSWLASILVNMNKNTAAGNTEVSAAVPPNASFVNMALYVYTEANDCYGVNGSVYSGSSGTNLDFRSYFAKAVAGAYVNLETGPFNFPMTSTSVIRNTATQANTSWTWAAAHTAQFRFRGYLE